MKLSISCSRLPATILALMAIGFVSVCTKVSARDPSAPQAEGARKDPQDSTAKLTPEYVTNGVKRFALRKLPAALVVTDVQFTPRASLGSLCALTGDITLKQNEPTFSEVRQLKYTANDGTVYQFSVLRPRLRPGDLVQGRVDTAVDTREPNPEIPFRIVTDVGRPLSQYPHPLLDQSELFTKTDGLIAEAEKAREKMSVIQSKWEALNFMQTVSEDQEAFERLLHKHGNPDSGVQKTIIEALGDPDLAKEVSEKIGYNNYFRQPNIKPDQEKFRTLTSGRLREEYERVKQVVDACKAKMKPCDDYLLTAY